MWPTTTRNVTATPPSFPAWWLGFYNSVSRVGFSDPGSYVYQHFRESVSDQPKSPEVTTSHCTLSQQDWKSLIQGLASACLRGYVAKMDSFCILQIAHAFTHTPIYTLNHLNLAHSHGSFLFQKSSFSFMLSDFSFPSCCLRGSLPLSLLKT